MTDKEQIIIHGIDVSKCKFYRPDSFPTDCEINPVNAYCGSSTSCNCHFKQLARKTQELYSAQNEVHFKTEYIQEQRDIIKKLEQECEELKSQIDADYEDYSQELKTLRNIIENKEKRNARLFVISNNYHKALEEIEEIVKGMRSIFIEEISITASQLNDRIYQESTARFRQILDIINKTKGE